MYKLSPSDFKYLWEGCKHCYWQKVRNGVMQPSIQIPGIFNRMSGLLQKSLQGQNVREFVPELPDGVFVREEAYLKSKPLPSGKSYLKGRCDLLVKFSDGTHGVIDAKMTDTRDESLNMFERQLHAYKYAFENPDEGEPIEISRVGLLLISPKAVKPNKGYFYYQAQPVYKEIPLNMDKFFGFIGEVEKVLDAELTKPSNSCDWCKYKHGSAVDNGYAH